MAIKYYSNGKLLLTGEYVVLDGALSLAIPTTYGQSLSVKEINTPKLIWKSLDEKGSIWLDYTFNINLFSSDGEDVHFKNYDTLLQTLHKILIGARKLNPLFLNGSKGFEVGTELDFPRNWGLGTSSTLINNIAQWAQVDPYELLWDSFGGSGYDIACAQHNTAILYQLRNGRPIVQEVGFYPPFKSNLFFVHLNKKQNSKEGIANYRKTDFDRADLVSEVSKITTAILSCTDLKKFETLLTAHENLISHTLKLPTIREQYFSGYPGALKSLGAWGGDFILATGNDETPNYFFNKGFKTIIPYEKMVLAP